MNLCRHAGGYGLVEGDQVIDITGHVPLDQDPDDFADPLVAAVPRLRELDAKVLRSGARRPLSEVALLSPVRRPSKILAAPNNFREHTAEMHSVDEASATRMAGIADAGFFLKATSSLVGPSQGVRVRFPERRTDHEIEFVIIIGARVDRPVTADRAMACVAGYALGLDITLRGPEERSFRKSIDTYTVLGPWLTTADEIADPMRLDMRLSVNGETRQATSLSDMVMGVADQVAFASRYYTLHPGDLIYTGSPSGVGPIRPGDVMHLEATGLGSMRVDVSAAD
jgi:2,4-diketo-3-deoxy-L-fuconate hydrolase